MPGRVGAVLVAHGSADPGAAVAVRSLARAVAAARPAVAVRAAYLDHTRPRPGEALAALAAAGCTAAVVVPLLFTEAYHGRVDLPAALARVRADGLTLPVRLVAGLGPGSREATPIRPATPLEDSGGRGAEPAVAEPALLERVVAEPAVPERVVAEPAVAGLVVPELLVAGLVRRLGEACDRPGPAPSASRSRRRAGGPGRADAVVLAAAGTRDHAARDTVAAVAARLGERLGAPCQAAYASAAAPTPAAAVAELRAAGAQRVAVAAYFLAPGRLYRLAAAGARGAGALLVARPLADAPEMVALVAHRIDRAVATGASERGALSGVR